MTSVPASRLAPSSVLDLAPLGVLVLDRAGRVTAANPAAVRFCGLAAGDDVRGSPFAGWPWHDLTATGPGAVADAPVRERDIELVTRSGESRRFACLFAADPDGEHAVVTVRDVTDERRQQRQLAALAGAATRAVAERSRTSRLDALAREVRAACGLAAVQIMTADEGAGWFEVMGIAGFGRHAHFVDRLQECRAAGAELCTLEAFTSGRPVVVPHRYPVVATAPEWAPIRDLMADPVWDWFASVPLLSRERPVGVLNAYFRPQQEVGPAELDFLVAMAEQTAQAVSYTSLLERESELARREERQRLARDLHDSVVQNMFSMAMQVESLGVLAGKRDTVDSAAVHRVAYELRQASRTVLADLRAMMADRHITATDDAGLVGAIEVLADTTRSAHGLDVVVTINADRAILGGLDPALREDVYRVIAEAVHNCVKHARGRTVGIDVTTEATRGRLVAEVVDDGLGMRRASAPAAPGYGMTTMRERAIRWGGRVTARDRPGGGTQVRLEVPLATDGSEP